MSLLYHAGMNQTDYITDPRQDKMSYYNPDKIMTIGYDTSLRLSLNILSWQEMNALYGTEFNKTS